MKQAVEAIILKSIPYQEKTYIVTVFSKELGKICIASRLSKKTHALSPLSLVEAVVTPSDKDILRCHSLEVRHAFFQLRQNLAVLQKSLQITEFLAYYLPLGAQASHLYDEFSLFLQHVAAFTAPHVAAIKFLATLSILDGTLSASPPLSESEALLCTSFASTPYEGLKDAHCDKTLLEKLLVVAGRIYTQTT